MRTFSFAALGILVGMMLPSAATAADLRVLAGGAMTAVWAGLKPKFEQTSGHKLDIFFGTTPNLIKEATSGKPFDVGVVPVEVMRDAAARSHFAAGPTMDIARVGLGVAVRAGAPKPNISTPEAFKAALLKAEFGRLDSGKRDRLFDREGIRAPRHHRANESQDESAADAGTSRRGGRQGRG